MFNSKCNRFISFILVKNNKLASIYFSSLLNFPYIYLWEWGIFYQHIYIYIYGIYYMNIYTHENMKSLIKS